MDEITFGSITITRNQNVVIWSTGGADQTIIEPDERQAILTFNKLVEQHRPKVSLFSGYYFWLCPVCSEENIIKEYDFKVVCNNCMEAFDVEHSF